jgi:hypothetical protein
MHAILLYFRAKNELARFPTLLKTSSQSQAILVRKVVASIPLLHT